MLPNDENKFTADDVRRNRHMELTRKKDSEGLTAEETEELKRLDAVRLDPNTGGVGSPVVSDPTPKKP
jgi:hypothetical protein